MDLHSCVIHEAQEQSVRRVYRDIINQVESSYVLCVSAIIGRAHEQAKFNGGYFFEIGDVQERRKTLAKFTKANIKVPKLLDPTQLSNLLSLLVDRTLPEISV